MSRKPRNKAGMDAEAVARMMAAQELEEGPEAEVLDAAPETIAPPMINPQVVYSTRSVAGSVETPEFDPGKIDGRTLRRTGREPFATRIKPETHAQLRRIAYAHRTTIAEALEMVVDAWGESERDRNLLP